MNRKDFIKSLIVGAAIAPAIITNSTAEPMPSVVSPELNFIEIDCDWIRISNEYEDRIYFGDGWDLHEKPKLVGKSSEIHGVSVNRFNELFNAMEPGEERHFLLKANKHTELISGFITNIQYKNDGALTLHIQHSKP